MVELIKEGIFVESKLVELNSRISIAFSEVHEEFQEHLESINENTTEIQSNYAYLCELDNKITKLNERIDDIHVLLSEMTGKKLKKVPSFNDIDPLTKMEKNVFLNIYAEENPITYYELSKRMNMSISLTRQYVLNLLEKGIPIQKIYVQTRPHILLDKRFKNLQAKENILRIEQRILV